MAYYLTLPTTKLIPMVARTSNKVVDQIWQELVMLRYIKSNNHARKATGSWIDQGKTYFLDAVNLNWRSAGLLYYYSFLNLAKALLVSRRAFTYKALNTKAIHHGLRSQLQDVSNISDYQIDIYMPVDNPKNPRTQNVFSHLYQVVTDTKWPFKTKITISLKEIMGYCLEISTECSKLFHIDRKVMEVKSLYREVKNEAWYEILVHNSAVQLFAPLIKEWGLDVVKFSQLTEIDKSDWLLSYHKSTQQLVNMSFLRSPKMVGDPLKNENMIPKVCQNASLKIEPYFLPPIHFNDQYPEWQYVSKIDLHGQNIKWHPLLSDYLISFALGNILRYQPQLLKTGTPNYFLAEAWCSQSSISSLRYFLMLFTSPPLLVEGY